MTIIRHIARQFDLVYLKPTNVTRAIQAMTLSPVPLAQNQRYNNRRQDRRCGVERREQRTSAYLDLRSSHSRRKSLGRRDSHAGNEQSTISVDVYV